MSVWTNIYLNCIICERVRVFTLVPSHHEYYKVNQIKFFLSFCLCLKKYECSFSGSYYYSCEQSKVLSDILCKKKNLHKNKHCYEKGLKTFL